MESLIHSSKFAMIAVLLVVTGTLPLCAQSKPEAALPNFAGTWKINHRESQSPSPVFEKTDVTLIVKQEGEQFTVEQKMKLNGHDQPSQPLTFKLSATNEAPVSRPVAGIAKLQARWINRDKRLELRTTIKTTLRNEKGDVTEEATLKTIEYWELFDEGRLLKLVRIREWPDRTETSRLVFERQ